jgi:lipopolysaccharide transport system ATP-binding protein
VNKPPMQGVIPPSPAVSTAPARLVKAVLDASNGSTGKEIRARSAVDDVTIRIEFESDPALPTPSVGVVFVDGSGRNICSAGSHIDKVHIVRDAAGKGQVQLTFPRIPLLKGDYFLDVFLLCERGIHVYEHAKAVSKLTMLREDLEQGVVSLPRRWN